MLINITLEKAVDAIIKRILPLGTEWVKAEKCFRAHLGARCDSAYGSAAV